MDNAKQFAKELAAFEANYSKPYRREAIRNKAMGRWSRRRRTLVEQLKLFFRRNSPPPEDPYAYVTAPVNPRSPRLKASAAVELPDDE